MNLSYGKGPTLTMGMLYTGDMVSLLKVKIPRETEVTPEMAAQFLSTFPNMLKHNSLVDGLIKGKLKPVISLEVGVWEQKIRFLVAVSPWLKEFVKVQIQSAYPLAVIEEIDDVLVSLVGRMQVGELQLVGASYYPIRSWSDFKDVDPMSAFLSVLAKAEKNEAIWLQFALGGEPKGWQAAGQAAIDHGRTAPNAREAGQRTGLPEAGAIRDKIAERGLAVSIRLGATSGARLNELASVFGVYGRPDGNHFKLKLPLFNLAKWQEKLVNRVVTGKKVLNISELATLWHLPGEKVRVPMIDWGKAVFSEPPENLPVADEADESVRKEINFFAKTVFKNKERIFGIKDADRRRHIWAVGKTGTGKSTLIANMVIDDLKKDRGVAIIDPHGDLCEVILDYIPSRRINDVVYFNPADRERPIKLNVLEVKNKEQRELVVSGIVAIFHKLYGHSWGPRLEYILRNTLLTLSEVEGMTLVEVPRMLTDEKFRAWVLERISDGVMKSFWHKEYNRLNDRTRQEWIGSILNKVGQFVASPMIRGILAGRKSSVDLAGVMNEGKILIANLSQGKIGEDNASLLGAMLITKIQLAAMGRVDLAEEQRRDFYLYVDEFQNFATDSFIKILSEARKYKLNLMMANQYMAQIPHEVQKAILGNVGSMISFTVGAEDARIIEHEFGGVFTAKDLVNLENYQIATRLMIDAHSSRAFLATTLPLPVSRNQNREKVIRVSRERWGR